MQKISFGYSNAKNVLESIDFDVNDGVFVSIIGPNGSGKSTLLKCLINVLKPKIGAVFIDQNKISDLHDHDLAKMRSAVLSDRVYPFNMSVRELISLGRMPHQKLLGDTDQKEQEIVLQSASLLGVENLLDRKFSELSDGQKQKVLIARAICQKPKVLILDEPATHLDTRSRVEILLKLREISSREKIIVIASMHEIEITIRMSDQIVILENGKIVAKGTPEQILEQGIMDEIYKNDKTIWSSVFGSLEIKCLQDEPKIHVVSSNGTGIQVFRLLIRMGYSFSVGILDQQDIDYYFAKEIKSLVFSNDAPYAPIQEELAYSLSKLGKVRIVIDCGFSINEHNKSNLDLIEILCNRNPAVLLSLRTPQEGDKIYGERVNVRYVSILELENAINEMITNSVVTKEVISLV